jgi:arylformamidase
VNASRILGRFALGTFLPLFLAPSLMALSDERDLAHVHIGGGLSHPPFAMTTQVWYRDIVYDDSASNKNETSLDIYTADAPRQGSPVMVFVHGGGFAVGDKAHAKDLDPKPEYFVSKLGYVLVSINYRLLPEGRYPRNVQDVANALAWVSDNIDDFGGDPGQIFMMGHSAGALLAAQVATDETFLQNAGKDLDLLSGVIVNDGGYGVEIDEADSGRQESLYGSDWRDKVPVGRVGPGKNIPPFMLLHVNSAQTMVPNTGRQALGFAAALQSADVSVEVVTLDHVEHFGANERIGEPGDITTVSVEHFLDAITGRKSPAAWAPAIL